MQTPSVAGSPQCMEPCFRLTVPWAGQQQERIVEKYLIRFRLAHIVLRRVLARVAQIPLKAFDLSEIGDSLYMTDIYARREDCLGVAVDAMTFRHLERTSV